MTARSGAPDLLWHSAAPWDVSAYGNQTRLVTDRLRAAGFDIEFSVPTGSTALEINGTRFWPADGMTAKSLVANVQLSFGDSDTAHVVAFTDLVRLFDVDLSQLHLLLWLPFNFDPLPRSYRETLERMNATILTPSAWGTSALARFGIPARHLPHGVDLSCFSQPSPSERREARSRLGIPRDAFVVGMVAANVEWVANRKSFPECLMGFAELYRQHPDSLLYLHTDLHGELGNGMDLVELIAGCGIPTGAVLITQFHRLRAGLAPEEMATLMSCFDVLLSPSAGEGFGIPVIEAQALGVPVVVSDFTSQPELVGAGWVVGGQRRWAPWVRSWLFTPDVGEISAALLDAYDRAESLRPEATRFAQSFCADRLVQEQWIPLLRKWLAE